MLGYYIDNLETTPYNLLGYPNDSKAWYKTDWSACCPEQFVPRYFFYV